MEMYDVRLAIPDQPRQFIPRGRRPNSPQAQSDIGTSAREINFIVVPSVLVNFIPRSEEEGLFRVDHRVFTTPIPIRIVSDDDLQGMLRLRNLR